jgi:hypothetical protein
MNRDDLGELDALLDQKLASFFGKFAEHFDTRLGELRTEMDHRFDQVAAALDGIAKRLDDDDQERTAIAAEQDRHGRWIRQLADHTGTKLVPEQ